MQRLGLLLLSGLVILMPGMLVLAATPPPDRDLLLVIAPPWAGVEGVVADAGGRVVGLDRTPFAITAVAEDPLTFRAAVRAAGAWAVLDASQISAFCGS